MFKDCAVKQPLALVMQLWPHRVLECLNDVQMKMISKSVITSLNQSTSLDITA